MGYKPPGALLQPGAAEKPRATSPVHTGGCLVGSVCAFPVVTTGPNCQENQQGVGRAPHEYIRTRVLCFLGRVAGPRSTAFILRLRLPGHVFSYGHATAGWTGQIQSAPCLSLGERTD